MKEDYDDLDVLLNLDGFTFYMEDGYWVKFDAHRITPTRYAPHGISYSITLHDANKIRIVGYDNAHSYLPKKRKYGAKKTTWDHIHKRKKVFPYEFDSACQLIEDFWKTAYTFI